MELGKRDPEGYFVIVASKEAKDFLPEGVKVEEVGDEIIIRTKSRSLAMRIVKELRRKGLLRW